jgi:hypothetical protein
MRNDMDDRSFAWLYAIELGGDLCLARSHRGVTPEPADLAIISRVVAVTLFGNGAALARERSHTVAERRFHVVDRH